MKKLICFFIGHIPKYKAWKDQLFGGYARYHSQHSCERCGQVLSHKSDIM